MTVALFRKKKWNPRRLGSSLAAWYKADAGCYTDAACLFASASSQYLSKTSATFAPTTKMTIAFDWKPTSSASTQLLCGAFTVAPAEVIAVQMDSAVIRVFIGGANFFTGSTALSNGTNYRVVVVYDGTLAAANRLAVYINGALESGVITGTIPTTLPGTVASINVGSYAAVAQYSDGALARLGFSSLALSGAALTAAHTSTFWADMTAARQADWFSFYNLCEASSTRVDSTGLNNLTPTNGPTVAAGPGEGACVDNSPCKRRNDQSGLGRDQTWATTATQPVWKANVKNGRPALLYVNGTTRALTAVFTQAQPLAVFVAGKHSSGTAAGNQLIVYGQVGAPGVYLRATGPGWGYYAGTERSAGTPDAAWHVHSAVFNGASSSRRVDGAEIDTGDIGAGGYTTYASGDEAATGGQGWDGYSSEEFLMAGVPTATQLSSAEAYLAQRWT